MRIASMKQPKSYFETQFIPESGRRPELGGFDQGFDAGRGHGALVRRLE